MFDIVVPETIKLLGCMSGYFEKAAAHAKARNYDVNTLLAARLAPDQFALGKQVSMACLLAEESLSKLAGKATPKHEADEGNVASLRKRIDATIANLKTLTRDDFNGWEERQCEMFFAPGQFMIGSEYLTQFALPDFYFHLMTVYSILRHNGVEVGKGDYLGTINMRAKG
jgi:hypothetical protein